MIISSRVKYCNLVKGRKSYVVIGIDVTTVYSSTVVEKRYEDFEIFQKTLSYFWNQKYEGGIFFCRCYGEGAPRLAGAASQKYSPSFPRLFLPQLRYIRSCELARFHFPSLHHFVVSSKSIRPLFSR